MKRALTYLNFDGNCREVMTFYGKCFGAEPNITPFSSGPGEMQPAANAAPDRILHAELTSGRFVLMASDTLPGTPVRQGNNFSICLDCDSNEEMERLFKALGDGGKVTMQLHDAFWGGRFGMLTDRFGISWMFSFREAGQHS